MADESKSSSSGGVTLADLKARVAAIPIKAKVEDARAANSDRGGGCVIATHHGTFHCDEALAVGLLLLLDDFKDAGLVRTRDPEQIKQANVVVDVGGMYDYGQRRFDHHQRSFTGAMSELGFDIKLSSAGLVYRHFGKQVLRALAGPKVSDAVLEILFKKLYKGFIREVDAIDNGVNVCDDADSIRYSIHTSLSARVSHLNPAWNESVDEEGINERFKSAVVLTTSEFIAAARRLLDQWLPAREVVQAAYNQRHKVHSSGRIMNLGMHCPWKSHLYDLEDEAKEGGSGVTEVYYVLYPDTRGKWRIQCVSISANSFVNRKSLPKPWCGVRDDALSTVSGIPGGVFCHANGFIGGNETYEGALRMAIVATEWKDDATAAPES